MWNVDNLHVAKEILYPSTCGCWTGVDWVWNGCVMARHATIVWIRFLIAWTVEAPGAGGSAQAWRSTWQRRLLLRPLSKKCSPWRTWSKDAPIPQNRDHHRWPRLPGARHHTNFAFFPSLPSWRSRDCNSTDCQRRKRKNRVRIWFCGLLTSSGSKPFGVQNMVATEKIKIVWSSAPDHLHANLVATTK